MSCPVRLTLVCCERRKIQAPVWRPATTKRAGLKPGLYTNEYIMALENCTLCRGTGWKLVPRGDGAAGKVAVACDCGMEKRASLVMERAKIPKRYEHCDFESYSTDVGSTPQQTESLKKAKFLAEGFVREYPGSFEKGLLFMGHSGVGKTHLAVAALKELIHRGHAGLFCDYRELLKEI